MPGRFCPKIRSEIKNMSNHMKIMKCAILLMLFLSLAVLPSAAEITIDEKILNKTTNSITVVDEVGRTVTISLPVKKIIACDYRQMETLLAMDTEDMIVGVATYYHDAYPFLGLKDAPVVSLTHATEMDYEKILLLEPDLLIVPRSQGASANEISKKLQGMPVLVFDLGHRAHIIPEVEILGQILGKEAEADKLINWINKYDSIVENRTKDLKSDGIPTFYYEATSTSSKWKANVPVGRSGSVAEGCSGRNIASELNDTEGIHSLQMDPEWVLVQNPDYIFLDFHVGKSGLEKTEKEVKDALDIMVKERASDGIGNVTAIRNNHTYAIDYDFVCGPRWVVGHVCFAKWLHPDLFEDIDPEQINKEFLKDFLGAEVDGTWVYPAPV
jgi:iron complex transport system substrate-binding protein